MSDIIKFSTFIIESLTKKGGGLVTAESCTAGLIIGALTDISGASSVIDRSFITYSNQAKHEMLGVKTDSLDTHGAVSAIVAEEMAIGALNACPSATHSIAVTGIAGPGGATDTKPVGLVYIGIGTLGSVATVSEHHFSGDRHSVRAQTVEAALQRLIEQLNN